MKRILIVSAAVLVFVAAVVVGVWRMGGSPGGSAAAGGVAAALEVYKDRHGTFPAAYGFVRLGMRDRSQYDVSPRDYYCLESYHTALRLYKPKQYADPDATSVDADGDGAISLLEYLPKKGDARRYAGKGFSDVVTELMALPNRPPIYAPVNLAQFEQAKRFWEETGDYLATSWNTFHPALKEIKFPPDNYDACVLVSPGPGGSTFGVAPADTLAAREPSGRENTRDIYHIAALRAYYLATRDLNGNGVPDFQYEGRAQGDEASLTYKVNGAAADNKLPDPKNPNGPGPVVTVLK